MALAQAAISGSIKATGIDPLTCSVNGATINLTINPNYNMLERSSVAPFSITGKALFSLSDFGLQRPTNYNINPATLSVVYDNNQLAVTSVGDCASLNFLTDPAVGSLFFNVSIGSQGYRDSSPFGQYRVTSTLTFVVHNS